jgi:hypothetical protein
MHFCRRGPTIGGMLPALRLSLLTAGLLLISSPAALAASGPSITVPAEGQVSVTFASGVKSVKVKSAPAGLTVAGGVKAGKLVVAVVHPRGVKASGKVVLTVKGKAKGTKTIAAALSGGKAPNCKDLAKLASKRLKGSADVKGLGAVLAAKLCGKAAPAGSNEVLTRLGLGAAPAPPAPPAPPAGNAGAKPSTGGGLVKPTPTPGAGGGGGKVCGNGVDDDGDGQVDLDDPGCADGNDTTETGEVGVSQDCLSNGSGVFMGDDPTGAFAAINHCGDFTKVRVDIAPGIASCQPITGGGDWDCKPAGGTYAVATAKDGKAIETMDLPMTLTGAAKCDRKATIALYRPNGEVAEIHAPIGKCNGGGGGQPAKPQCADGKDNDGDGMIDDHFVENADDPDPGCSSTTDDSENSELLPAGDCHIDMDLWDDNRAVAVAVVEGCGVIQGFWFNVPGNPTTCRYQLSEDGEIEDCWTRDRQGGFMFNKTTLPLAVAVGMSAVGDCRPLTFALITGDNTVVRQRVKPSGC